MIIIHIPIFCLYQLWASASKHNFVYSWNGKLGSCIYSISWFTPSGCALFRLTSFVYVKKTWDWKVLLMGTNLSYSCLCLIVWDNNLVWALPNRHDHVWTQSCLVTMVCGHNHICVQSFMGKIVYWHNRVWALSCLGTNYCV